MSERVQPKDGTLSLLAALRVDETCDRYDDAWKAGKRPRIEDFLGNVTGPERSALLRGLLRLDLDYGHKNHETPILESYQRRFPEDADLIGAVFQEKVALNEPAFGDVNSAQRLFETGPELSSPAGTEVPARLGRYRVTAKLGEGTFGVVYRGYDDELRRDVAIKVPHRHLVSRPEDVQLYLAEARVLASLDHPHIVFVYDFGRTDDGLCYVVSKFIEGSDLAKSMEQGLPSATESAELVATVAEALHHAHLQGLVHRDVKPSNILIDSARKPYVADFGLALKEEDFGKGAGFAGTPVYMSPEQARGEGHRVDGRSDIFSLGVVFYELLTGRRPFRGETRSELLEQIATVEARPPRQWDDSIPKELEGICLKAMSKRASERYTTAKDVADDLRHFVEDSEEFGSTKHRLGDGVDQRSSTPEWKKNEGDRNPLYLIWDSLDPCLQTAFSLAYFKKRMEGSDRISTRDLFQALVRIQDDAFSMLSHSLPEGSLPNPVDAIDFDLEVTKAILESGALSAKGAFERLNFALLARAWQGSQVVQRAAKDSTNPEAPAKASQGRRSGGSLGHLLLQVLRRLLGLRHPQVDADVELDRRTVQEGEDEHVRIQCMQSDAAFGNELQKRPLLSDCIEDSLAHFVKSAPMSRKLSSVDIFVDIAKHGHGPSVARLRGHGVTAEEIERRVGELSLPVLRRSTD